MGHNEKNITGIDQLKSSNQVRIKDFSEKKITDYVEAYSLITKFILIIIILTIVSSHDLDILHMDVKTRFLNGVKKTNYI